MIIEGKGLIAPARLKIDLFSHDLVACAMAARERAKFRRYATGHTKWQRGLVDSLSVIPGLGPLTSSEVPTFIGCVGEWAIIVALGLHKIGAGIDDALRAAGDHGVDVKADRVRIQVKTRSKIGHESTLVRVPNRDDAVDVLALCQFVPGDTAAFVLGWERFAKTMRRPKVDASCRQWMNWIVPDCDLLPMSRLLDEIRAIKEQRRCP
jgi:hypothetical protein